MLIYDDIENFPSYRNQFDRFENVTVFSTKYSKKIDFGKKKVFLRIDNAEQKVNILVLINKVKKDAQNYINKVKFKTTKDYVIFWSFFNDNSKMLKNGLQNIDLCKIDLTAAYWSKAINEGILSKDTVKYFESLNFPTESEKKMARLKAFGSLATVKNIEVFNYGVIDKDILPPIKNKEFIDLYMWVCNSVAQDMQTALSKFDGIYYYWDCIFVEPKNMLGVTELFTNLGYKCTVENHKGSVHIGKNISNFCCPNKKGKLIEYQINN